MDSRAIVRMDIRFYVGMRLWALLKSLYEDLCPFGLPLMLTVAHVAAASEHDMCHRPDRHVAVDTTQWC